MKKLTLAGVLIGVLSIHMLISSLVFDKIRARIVAQDPIVHIAEEEGVSVQTIYNRFRDLIKEGRVSYWEKRSGDILDSYKTHQRVAYVERELGASGPVIRRVLRSHGIEPHHCETNQHARKYPLDQTFFDVIDTEAKAYYLGLMFADGCVHIRTGGRPSMIIYSISISLKGEDRSVLEGFSNVLYGADRLVLVVYKDGRGKDAYRLDVRSKHMCESLIRLGCTPRKSLTLCFPTQQQVPSHLLHHFLRGYWDGDGTVGIYQKRKTAGFVASIAFARGLQAHLKNVIGHSGYYSEPHNRGWAQVAYGKQAVVIALRDYLYRDATIWMQRKRDKFYA